MMHEWSWKKLKSKACFFILLFWALISSSLATASTWVEVDIGIIGASSDDILQSAVALAKERGAAGLTIRLDTPGGSLEVTRSMVKTILNADFPVLVWVGPSGSRAASAGAFITLAAHIAAMAPGTNIGAAHPIQIGMSGDKNEQDSHAAKKIENDTAAFIESIAKTRARNVEMAVSFVLASTSIAAEQALENKVIDLIASDLSTLYQQVDGREVLLASGTTVKIQAANAQIIRYESSLRQSLLTILSNPNLFYLLFIAGIIGLGFELTHPGALFPGVLGGVAMILALISMSILPVNFGALLLLLVGIAFMVGEMFLPSFGVLGFGGFAAFVLGSILLIDPGNVSGLAISLVTIIPGTLAVAGAAIAIAYLVVKSERSRVISGTEGMKGERGEALQDFVNGEGQVRVEGEIWSARTDDASVSVRGGDRVEIMEVQGLLLLVRRIS